VAGIILAALLLLLAFRLTAAEALRDTLSQKIASIAPGGRAADRGRVHCSFVGPLFTAAYAGLTFLFAALASFLAGRAGRWVLRRVGSSRFWR